MVVTTLGVAAESGKDNSTPHASAGRKRENISDTSGLNCYMITVIVGLVTGAE